MSVVKAWIEAMRLRTLPVSVAGVLCAVAYAIYGGCFKVMPSVLCFVFAVLAQVSSNFANEYYDFKHGLDKAGREGPRRGVTEGDITARAMKIATFATLGLACCVGCSLIYWGGFWLIAAGILIALGVLAYSAGPYPVSQHGLGEVAVVFYFGIIPINLTYYIMSGVWTTEVFLGSVAIGLMGANVLIVNNYRDMEDDEKVGKHTLAVLAGRRIVSTLYLLNGFAAVGLMSGVWLSYGVAGILVPVCYLILHCCLYANLIRRRGRALNPLLGMTAMLMLCYVICFMILTIIYGK